MVAGVGCTIDCVEIKGFYRRYNTEDVCGYSGHRCYEVGEADTVCGYVFSCISMLTTLLILIAHIIINAG